MHIHYSCFSSNGQSIVGQTQINVKFEGYLYTPTIYLEGVYFELLGPQFMGPTVQFSRAVLGNELSYSWPIFSCSCAKLLYLPG